MNNTEPKQHNRHAPFAVRDWVIVTEDIKSKNPDNPSRYAKGTIGRIHWIDYERETVLVRIFSTINNSFPWSCIAKFDRID